MPSTTPELRAKILAYFGPGADDSDCVIYLQSKEFTLTNTIHWTHPTIKSTTQMSDQEWDCFLYLTEEWDFGGLEK